MAERLDGIRAMIVNVTQDTAIGGPSGRFPETRHSAIAGAGDTDPVVRRQSYEAIVAAYWKPIYQYIRIRWQASNEDAKDLTQAFFSQSLEKNTLTAYDPAKGTFRTWLRVCLDSFVINLHRHSTRQKRAGDAGPRELEFDVASEASIDEILHQEWTRSLFSLAIEALRADSLERGRQVPFAIFEKYDLVETPPTYAELAREFNLTPVTVTNYLAAMRRDLRKAVLAKLRELTATEREFRTEARALLNIEV